MCMGSNPVDGKNLIVTSSEKTEMITRTQATEKFLRRYLGGNDILKGLNRYCLWIGDDEVDDAIKIPDILDRINSCAEYRKNAGRDAKKVAHEPHRFCYRTHNDTDFIAIPKTSSSGRVYVPANIYRAGPVVNVDAFAIYDANSSLLSLLMSKMHNVWLATTSGRLGEGYRYSVKLSYNTFPIPDLTKTNRRTLTQCAANIMLVRESHFPCNLSNLYDPEKMPNDLRAAHDENDETLERIYIGRKFKNDTERLEKLFEMYTKMTAN